MLKFDKATLIVEKDLPGKGAYTAVIKGPVRLVGNMEPVRLSRDAPTRIEAVRQVWDLYNKCREEYHSNLAYWSYEFAMGDVELQLIKNRYEHRRKQ